MKNLRLYAVCVSILFMGAQAFAQNNVTPPFNEPDYNKPLLFAHLPSKIAINLQYIDPLFNAQVGTVVDMSFSDNGSFRFDGKVVTATSKLNGSVQKLMIKSSNYNGANFLITKTIRTDGTIQYHGRILSFKYGDFYELQKDKTGYYLQKKNFYDLVNE